MLFIFICVLPLSSAIKPRQRQNICRFSFCAFIYILQVKEKIIAIKNINCIKTASDENAVLSVFFGGDLKNLDIINLEGVAIHEKIL